MRGSQDVGSAGVGARYDHRNTAGLSVFGQGTFGYGWDERGRGWRAEALGGVWWRF